jgi:DNA-binding MarR family transcriptional regulator
MDETHNPFDLTEDERRAAGPAADAVRCFRIIAYAAQRLRYLIDRRLAADGLTSQQGFLLTVVRQRGRPTLGEVAAAMSTSHQNARQVATALERKGMLRIAADADDARVRRLEPTEASQDGWESRNADDFAAIAVWFGTLSPDDQRQLADLLEHLASGLREAGRR